MKATTRTRTTAAGSRRSTPQETRLHGEVRGAAGALEDLHFRIVGLGQALDEFVGAVNDGVPKTDEGNARTWLYRVLLEALGREAAGILEQSSALYGALQQAEPAAPKTVA